MLDSDALCFCFCNLKSDNVFSTYSEVGSMKTGDYMIHVSNHLRFFPSLNLTLSCLIRYISSVARISSVTTRK